MEVSLQRLPVRGLRANLMSFQTSLCLNIARIARKTIKFVLLNFRLHIIENMARTLCGGIGSLRNYIIVEALIPLRKETQIKIKKLKLCIIINYTLCNI